MSTAERQRPAPARAVGLAAIVAVGWFIGGPIGLVVAALALALALWRGPRLVAGLACVALVATALLTAVEAPTGPNARGVRFVTDRPLTSETGRIAGVLALVSIAVAIARERATDPPNEGEPNG